MKDLEPILDVLCNYHAGFVLSEAEIKVLCDWLAESPDHERLFDQLRSNNGMQFILGLTERNIREKIQSSLIEMDEKEGEF